MHYNEFKRISESTLEFFLSVFPILFWIFIIFSFDSPRNACLYLFCAFIHESGHLLTACLFNGKIKSIKYVLNGIKLSTKTQGSYTQEFFLYVSGAFANIVACLLALPFSAIVNSYDFVMLNIATATSNLLPIEGYDGYGAIKCILEKNNSSSQSFAILECISSLLIFALCVTALYLIDRCGEGYWIFLVLLIKKLSKTLKKVKTEQKGDFESKNGY